MRISDWSSDVCSSDLRLIHVSPALKERNAAKAVERLSLIAQGWSGGTRIGESLAGFNRHHAPRVVHGRSVVMIVSDGYDTGASELLAREMRSEEHTSQLQSLMRTSYVVFCLKKKTNNNNK